MRELAYKLLEVLILKFENKIQNPQFQLSESMTRTYENTFPIIFEDVRFSRQLLTLCVGVVRVRKVVLCGYELGEHNDSVDLPLLQSRLRPGDGQGSLVRKPDRLTQLLPVTSCRHWPLDQHKQVRSPDQQQHDDEPV